MTVLPTIIIAALLLYVAWLRKQRNDRDKIPAGAKPLPGPKNYPLVGRVHDVPAERTWLKFYEWSKEYGPIYGHEMFGSTHVWISSEQIAHDLLSKRASIYSDRPVIPTLPDNRTSGDYLALLGRTDTWKRQRKLCQHLMTTSANDSLHGYPSRERDRFLYLMYKDPSQYREYVEQFTSRTVSRLAWGTAHPAKTLRVTTLGLLETISPAGSLPNVISWLGNLPDFLNPWRMKEHSRHAVEAKFFKNNVQYVHHRIDDSTASPSFIRTFVDSLDPTKWGQEREATYVVGLMAIAGALTIGSPVQSFILAMLHYPGWLKRLQTEIDTVCDGSCPQWEDREKLPMLRAVVKEVIRWRPPVPTGIPHAVEKDDVYNGYFIPAGATIHALEWAITRDESVYPDPEAFNPSRWLEPTYPTYKEPLTVYPNLNGFSQFGFGRRTCQGIPIVDQDLFLAMGGMAWAFDLRKKRRSDGSEVPVHWNDYTPLLIAKPAPFEFEAAPRDERKKAELEAMWEKGRGEDDDEEEENLQDAPAHQVKTAGAMKDLGDEVSDRGSETSGDAEGGSLSAGSPSGASDTSDAEPELDIWS